MQLLCDFYGSFSFVVGVCVGVCVCVCVCMCVCARGRMCVQVFLCQWSASVCGSEWQYKCMAQQPVPWNCSLVLVTRVAQTLLTCPYALVLQNQ